MTLNELPVGRPARVCSVEGRGRPVMLRLMEMGLVPGASVRVRKRAPFRGPLELWVGGYILSIRSNEARLLGVTPEPERLESTVVVGPAPALRDSQRTA